jgi:DNA-binding MarR family transcriptional regulator/GNAT superfamily N-acetyltransferase
LIAIKLHDTTNIWSFTLVKMMCETPLDAIRDASRKLVREFGFMSPTIAGSDLSPSSVHALVEIGKRGEMTAAELCEVLQLEKSSVSRMLRKFIASGEIEEGLSKQDGRAKLLSLTPKGQIALAAINNFARAQVAGALERLPTDVHGQVLYGLATYASALAAYRNNRTITPAPAVDIERGYRPGMIGRTVEMQADYYARLAGFGSFFESKLAAEMASFVNRLAHPSNDIWLATQAGNIIGAVAIDGQDLANGRAHLRWFIVADGQRGNGVGKRLLASALAFCDRMGVAETELWTFQGLDAARRLYEAAGFILTEEQSGRQWGKEMTEQCFIRKAPIPPR